MRSLRKVLKKMDPNLSVKDKAFNAALVLLAAAEVGPSADKIAKRAVLPRKEARQITARCRKARLFVKGQIHHGGWFDKDSGGIAFWMDVACVNGLLKRIQPGTAQPEAAKGKK